MSRGAAVEHAERALCQVSHPTYMGKEGTLPAWWECVQAQTYQPRTTFVVDNTMLGTMYLKTLHDEGIEAIHLQPWTDKSMEFTFKRCWELILERAQRDDAFWVLSLEADNIISPEALEKMVKLAVYGNCHLVTHEYPLHQEAAAASGLKGDEFWYTDMGCMLMTRQLLERGLELFDEFKKLSVAIFNANERYRGGHVRLTQCFARCDHLDDWAHEFPQFADPDPDEPSYCPAPEFPDYFGSKLPPTLEKYLATTAKET
jgi:hypothetical protein